jgi:topoisomerase-4 subunit A
MKLKDGDEVVSAFIDNGNSLFITKNGYYLYFNSEEISIVSSKAAGVKGIKVKDDEVITGMSLDESIEYLSVITDKNTAKRIKVSELEFQSRALKGSSLIKRVKSKPYNITKVLPTNIKNIIGLKMDTEIKGIKASDIPIMDLTSTGSTISKQVVDDAFIVSTLVEKKLDEDAPKKEEVKEKTKEKEEIEELTIDDFLDDFKL